MQSYDLQAFETVATTAVERRHSNRSSPAGLEHTKKETPIGCLFSVSLRARDVAERPGDIRLRRPQRSGDIRTVLTRQGLNIQKKDIHRMSLFYIFESTRRDSNPRPSPWQGDTPPLSHSCTTYLQNHILKSIFTVSSTNQTFLDKPSTD